MKGREDMSSKDSQSQEAREEGILYDLRTDRE